MPYSVSPRRNDHSVGPKPTKYCVAFMPNRLAVSRWPASCRQTDTRMPSANDQRLRARSSCGAAPVDRCVRRQLAQPARAAQSSAASTSATVRTFPTVVLVRAPARRCRRCPGTAAGRRGRPPRTPRWRRCRPPGRCRRPRPPRGPARTAGNAVVVQRHELPGAPPASSRSAVRRAGHPVRPAERRARSAAACPAGWPGRASSRRRTRPSSARPTAGGRRRRSASYGTSNSRCASITSRPLLTSVAELIVTTGPMSQVGWASACSAVTSASSSRRAAAERAAAGGEDQPAHLVGPAAAQALGERRVLGVDRDDLAGRCAAARTSGPPATSDSLLASARVRPASSAASVGREADRAGHAVEHDVARPARRARSRRPARPGSSAPA